MEKKSKVKIGSETRQSRSGITPGGRPYKTTKITNSDSGKTSKVTDIFRTGGRAVTYTKNSGGHLGDGNSKKRNWTRYEKTPTSIKAKVVAKGPTKPLRKKTK